MRNWGGWTASRTDVDGIIEGNKVERLFDDRLFLIISIIWVCDSSGLGKGCEVWFIIVFVTAVVKIDRIRPCLSLWGSISIALFILLLWVIWGWSGIYGRAMTVCSLTGVNPFGVDVNFLLETVDHCGILDTADAAFETTEVNVALDNTIDSLLVTAEGTVENFLKLGILFLGQRLCGTLSLSHAEFIEWGMVG